MTVSAVPDWPGVAEAAARAGGAVLLRHFRDPGLQVGYKDARANLVTVADTESQQAIAEVIRAKFPGHAIIGEEGTAGGDGITGDREGEYAWYIDPLDGTTNFAHGLPFFCVSVALRGGYAGRPGLTLAGVIYDPLHDELFAAARFSGAYLNKEPLTPAATARLARSLVVAQAQSVEDGEIRAYSALVDRLMRVAGGVRSLGSPALSLCAIAAGRLEAYCEYAMDPWDILAGQLILEEAGGRVTTFTGAAPYQGAAVADRADIVATNGPVHDELITALKGLPRP